MPNAQKARRSAAVKRRSPPAKKALKKAAKVRAPKTIENDETCLHMHCWQWVQKAYPGLLIFHVANERQAAVQYHVKLKRMGVLGGVGDFLAFPDNGRKAAIELKDNEGVQDADQIKFQKRWERSGGLYFVCRTLEEFQGVVNGIMLFA